MTNPRSTVPTSRWRWSMLRRICGWNIRWKLYNLKRAQAIIIRRSWLKSRSASAIRAAIQRGDTCAALNCLPENCRKEFRLALGGGAGREACALTDASFIDDLALFTLRQHSPQSLSAFAGVSEGLENLLIQEARVSPDVQSLLSACKSKRYTLSRLRRLLPQIALGIIAIQCRWSRPALPMRAYWAVGGMRFI